MPALGDFTWVDTHRKRLALPGKTVFALCSKQMILSGPIGLGGEFFAKGHRF
jgi:hypothetical protein